MHERNRQKRLREGGGLFGRGNGSPGPGQGRVVLNYGRQCRVESTEEIRRPHAAAEQQLSTSSFHGRP
eukprot:3262689-Lingulodinium_polyedra.AAC.1